MVYDGGAGARVTGVVTIGTHRKERLTPNG